MIYYIADTHFGHENIMKRSKRPFESVAEMDRAIIGNINSVVSKHDDLYILGDFCHWNKEVCYPSDYLSKINGHKHFILGNHDRNILRDKYAARYLEEIMPYAEIKDGDKKVVLSHFPMAEWNGYFTGAYHIHGHIHNSFNNPVFGYMAGLERCYNAGVDVIGFTPRTLDELMQMREKGLLYGECYKDNRDKQAENINIEDTDIADDMEMEL
jgi:calcineurin-like phosphoesterase family protein